MGETHGEFMFLLIYKGVFTPICASDWKSQAVR